MKNKLMTFLLAGVLVAGFSCSSNKGDRNPGTETTPVDGLDEVSATDQAETTQTAPDSLGAAVTADSIRATQ